MADTVYLGLACVSLANDALSLLVTRSVGPRVISLKLNGKENIFAELPGVTLDFPGDDVFHMWGGHRLWHAPEIKRRTYIPDNKPVTIEEHAQALHVTAPIEPETGLQKTLRITLPDDSPTVIVDHILTNHGLWAVETAPWAITQLKPGGVAILPQQATAVDPDGVRANRSLVLWPYTNMRSPYINWGNRAILVRALLERGKLKLGFPNPAGWLAYYREGLLFIKRASFVPDAYYFERDSSSQCFCNPDFLELETSGPCSSVAPGRSITHREVWELHGDISLDLSIVEPAQFLEQLIARLDIHASSPHLKG